jgi:translocation and assembly module TamB
VRVTGPVRLTGSPSADLTIALQQIGLKEPALLESSIDGSIRFNGPLAGGARIDGALTLGLTEIRIPETGLRFGGDIPAITHINEPRAVRISRQRGGILSAAEQARQQSNSSSAAYPIDLVINAPSRIFIRGRGLDAELGGQLRLSGTTADLRPIGQFELVRGRLDLLGKRLSLDEGLIAMAGNFSPTIELVARAVSSGITAVVTITRRRSARTVVLWQVH